MQGEDGSVLEQGLLFRGSVCKDTSFWFELGEKSELVQIQANSIQLNPSGWPNDTQLHRSCELGSSWFELGVPFCQGLMPCTYIHSTGNYNLVPLAFREKPPKISESFLQAISDRRDETQDSSSETLLQEFCPKYGRSLNDGGDDDSVGAATPVDENPRLGAQVDPGRSREPTTEDLASCSRTLGLYESVSPSNDVYCKLGMGCTGDIYAKYVKCLS